MKITVAVVACNEEKNIGACLRSLLRQKKHIAVPALFCHPRARLQTPECKRCGQESGDPGQRVICMDPPVKPEDDKEFGFPTLPAGRLVRSGMTIEILVVDDGSTDRTREVVKELQGVIKQSRDQARKQESKKAKKIRIALSRITLLLLTCSRSGIAAARNVALERAKGDLVVFIDADCVAPKNWLATLTSYPLSPTPSVVAVGGGNKPPDDTPFHQALGIMLNTFLGSRGSVQGRRYRADRFVNHLPTTNVLYDRKAVLAVGGFDEKLGSIIEDEDLSLRLRKAGKKLVYLADAEVIHKSADNWQEWGRKMVRYGEGRIIFLRKHPEEWNTLFVLPMVLVVLLPIIWPAYLLAMAVYTLVVIPAPACKRLSVSDAGRKAGIQANGDLDPPIKSEDDRGQLEDDKKILNFFFRVFFLFIVTHLAYGIGEISQFVSPSRSPFRPACRQAGHLEGVAEATPSRWREPAS